MNIILKCFIQDIWIQQDKTWMSKWSTHGENTIKLCWFLLGPVGGFNTMRPRQNGHHFADNIFKCIFMNENVWIVFKISLNFVPKGRINNIPALVQIMAWRWWGDKPLYEPMMLSLLTHICITWPQWVKCQWTGWLLLYTGHTIATLSVSIYHVTSTSSSRWFYFTKIQYKE